MAIILSRDEILHLLPLWYKAWNDHDLDAVMDLFHDDILFVNWNGSKVAGKNKLRMAWVAWFKDHGQFQFHEEETFVDDVKQKVLFRWVLDWPSSLKHKDGREKREGVDVLYFYDGKIIKKLTYTRTDIVINGEKINF